MVNIPKNPKIEGILIAGEDGKFKVPEKFKDKKPYSVMTDQRTMIFKKNGLSLTITDHPKLRLDEEEKILVRVKVFGGDEYFYKLDLSNVEDE